MKRVMMVICGMFMIGAIKAQAFDEWFRQKKTQRKYLVEQIAALQAYAHVLEKGCRITKNGLTLISHIKQGDVLMHRGYFCSLSSVNPYVAYYSRILEITALQASILKQCSHIRTLSSSSFSPANGSYYHTVLNQLVGDCDATVNELTDVLTDGRLQLTDDERIARIDNIYQTMKDRYSFVRHFHSEIQLLNLQMNSERRDADRIRFLYKPPRE